MILDMLKSDARIKPSRVLVDHVEEHTIRESSRRWLLAGMTLYPITKCTPQRACDMIEMYGPERLMANSAGDWGPSKPTAIPDLIMEMRKRGHSQELIRKGFTKTPRTSLRKARSSTLKIGSSCHHSTQGDFWIATGEAQQFSASLLSSP